MMHDTTPGRVFDWRPNHDERSRNYTIADLIEPPPRVDKEWDMPREVLDQGNEGACVGFAFANDVLGSPKPRQVPRQVGEQLAHRVYRRAQVLDRWPGANYSGTSVLAGAKTTVEMGFATGYRWAFTTDEIIDALCAPARHGGGPVVIGVPWYSDMYDTAPSGLVMVGGKKVGGHAITLTGYRRRMRFAVSGTWEYHEVVRWRNSWGAQYGRNGDGFITLPLLRHLLDQGGEACLMTGRRRVTHLG